MKRKVGKSWLKVLPNTLKQHVKCPDIDLETYRRINQVQLAYSVTRRRRVYLDTMVWIRFRDIALGQSGGAAYEELYSTLLDACREKVICPLSYSSVSELLTQEDKKTRTATARVMDNLSHAICLRPPHELFSTELEHFLLKAICLNQIRDQPIEMAWTKIGWWVGQPTLWVPALTPLQLLAMQKSIDDAMDALTVEMLARSLPSKKSRARTKQSAQSLATELNVGKVDPANVTTDYRKLFESEVRGGLDAHESELAHAACQLARTTGFKGPITAADRKTGSDIVRNLVGTAYKRGRIQSEIPQIHINASLHAAVRYDQRRKYKPNDFEDFRHAGSALPYCEVFITEKSLAHLLLHPPASLAESYGCAVFSDPAAALDHLRRLAA